LALIGERCAGVSFFKREKNLHSRRFLVAVTARLGAVNFFSAASEIALAASAADLANSTADSFWRRRIPRGSGAYFARFFCCLARGSSKPSLPPLERAVIEPSHFLAPCGLVSTV